MAAARAFGWWLLKPATDYGKELELDLVQILMASLTASPDPQERRAAEQVSGTDGGRCRSRTLPVHSTFIP